MSTYALHPDFADIPNSKKGSDAKWLLKIANVIIRGQSKKWRADGVHTKETRLTIPGYQGALIKIRIYEPANTSGQLPCVVSFHGGAFVGDVMPHQINYCLKIAEQVPCKVVLVEYRLALDFPFPYGVEDSYAALQWVFDHAEDIGVDRNRIGVFGDSSGGNYAAAVCLMARDRKANLPCYQMLIYPAVDSSRSTPSARNCLDTPELNSYGVESAWKYYLQNGDQGMPGYASPYLAEDLSGLPPAYVETTEFDPLHDEDVLYAEKLQAAGVPVELNETKGSYHGFDIKLDRPYSQRALAHRIEVLKKVLG